MAVTEERVSDLEATMQKLAYEHMNTEIILQNSAREHERLRAEMNKKWEEFANKMGTIVEDIIAPNIPTIAKQYFGVEEFTDFALNYRKQHPARKDQVKEFDVIAVSEQYLFLNETKSTARDEYLQSFAENHREVLEVFPEIRDKTLVPIFSSLHLSQQAVAYLTKNGIYAMAMKGDTMDLLNFAEVSK